MLLIEAGGVVRSTKEDVKPDDVVSQLGTTIKIRFLGEITKVKKNDQDSRLLLCWSLKPVTNRATH